MQQGRWSLLFRGLQVYGPSLTSHTFPVSSLWIPAGNRFLLRDFRGANMEAEELGDEHFFPRGSRTRDGNRGAELIESWSPAKVLSTVVVVVRVPDFCDKPGQSRGKLPNLLLILCSEFLVVTFIVFRKVLMMQILWAQRWEGNVNN